MQYKLKIQESYEGVVQEILGDSAVIRFEIRGGTFGGTYRRSKFCDGVLPPVGAKLHVSTNVFEVLDEEVPGGIEENGKPVRVGREPLFIPDLF